MRPEESVQDLEANIRRLQKKFNAKSQFVNNAITSILQQTNPLKKAVLIQELYRAVFNKGGQANGVATDMETLEAHIDDGDFILLQQHMVVDCGEDGIIGEDEYSLNQQQPDWNEAIEEIENIEYAEKEKVCS